MKHIKVSHCSKCPYGKYNGFNGKTNKLAYRCVKDHLLYKSVYEDEPIPDWCPLPNLPSDKKE